MKTRFRVFVGSAGVAAICLAVLGVWMEFGGVAKSFEGELNTAIAMIVAGMILCAGAIVVPLNAMRRAQAGSRLQERKDQYPSQPWKWIECWDCGRVSAGGSLPLGQMTIALFWNAVLVVIALLAFEQWRVETSALKWLAVGGPAIGTWLIIAATVSVSRWYLFRESVLELDTCPVPVGGELRGVIETQIAAADAPLDEFRVAFTCLREVTPTIRHMHSRREAVVWRSVSTFRACPSLRNAATLAVPVRFGIPGDVPSTTPGMSNDRYVWSVDVEAKTRHLILYKATFDLPVFDYPFVREVSQSPGYHVDRVPVSATGDSPLQGVAVKREGANLSVTFGRGRERRLAVSLVAFALCWLGLTALIFFEGAPVSVTAMFVAFAAIPVWRSIAPLVCRDRSEGR